ncbi:Rv3235 family protein [Saccharopolyspora sp. MS10]|uniref:Rv3235 family protein n=1 Tax=Saccharopolyspora sp. MS10 TaxID=3385973 RepID=UPI0039A05F69
MTAPAATPPILLPAAPDTYLVPDSSRPAQVLRVELPNPATAPADRTSDALAASLGAPVVEVLLGRRPVEQIRPRVSPRVERLLRSRPVRRLLNEPAQRLLSTHACVIGPDLVEGCAVITSRVRTRALVLRWERGERGWLCTFLSIV